MSVVRARCGRIEWAYMRQLGRERPWRAGSRCSGIARGRIGELFAPSRDAMGVPRLPGC